MVKKLMNALVAIIFIAGVGLLVYPSFSDWWNKQHRSEAIASYEKKVASLTEKQYQQLWNGTGTGIMGYVEIPKINVSLPIYHGDDQAILQIAIGHIPGTSLPVGGKGTHSVLSGHRGLPSARLFTDIDQLKKGDIFMLQVMDNTLTYKVDQISVVLPSDMSKLQIDSNQDYCTLMTCTPYGVNTHRLLVRGHRISRKSTRVARNLTRADYVIWDLSWGLICLILVIILIRMVKQRRKTIKS